MSGQFVFQVEESLPCGPTVMVVEGRCCKGSVQTGDLFNELIICDKDENGSTSVEKIRVVEIKVEEIKSIRPGMLGVVETGTLRLEIGSDSLTLLRGDLLKGNRCLQD